jgi:hypothetical protein
VYEVRRCSRSAFEEDICHTIDANM